MKQSDRKPFGQRTMKDDRWDAILRPIDQPERRKHPRFFLDLPLDYRVMDLPDKYGGIVINGGEEGLLLHCLQEMPVGTRLTITVLFPLRFELTSLEVLGKVVRRDRRKGSDTGYNYGLSLIKVKEKDRLKLKHLLKPSPFSHV